MEKARLLTDNSESRMEKPTFKEESLKYHIEGKPGKLEVRATTPLETQADLSMAYSPGVAHACEYIVEDP